MDWWPDSRRLRSGNSLNSLHNSRGTEMLNSFWGFHSTPFANPTGAGFLPTAASEEAFARIQYLVDQNHRLGILQGESGIGKSVLLGAFERTCKAADREACQINVVGMGLSEFLHQVAMQLNVFDSHDTADTWQKIFDQIQLNGYQQRDTVLLFDDVDETHPEVLTAIRRLAHLRFAVAISIDDHTQHGHVADSSSRHRVV